MRDEAHGDEDDEEVEPYGAVLPRREGINEENRGGSERGRDGEKSVRVG